MIVHAWRCECMCVILLNEAEHRALTNMSRNHGEHPTHHEVDLKGCQQFLRPFAQWAGEAIR